MPNPRDHRPPAPDAVRLTRWSLLMLPGFALVFFVTDILGLWVLGLRALHEGDLFLMQRGFAGWFTEVIFVLVPVSAPVAGVWLAIASLRRGGRAGRGPALS